MLWESFIRFIEICFWGANTGFHNDAFVEFARAKSQPGTMKIRLRVEKFEMQADNDELFALFVQHTLQLVSWWYLKFYQTW